MDKLVLIDGNSIVNRAFYGVPDLTNREGLHTNAIYGFLNILLKILDEENPTIFWWHLMSKHRHSVMKCLMSTKEQENRCRENSENRFRY